MQPRTFSTGCSSTPSEKRCGAHVMIQCSSSDGLEPLIAWVRAFPKGGTVAVRLPLGGPEHSPAMRKVTGELLSMGCRVTLRRIGGC
ncbi:hypothetical protein FJZ27_02425 [Candidatus Peribacteria bacterium]|nr:hypothetical protein [Candidatus Peribacteria bacterium]